ncbi:MAG: hypothetical protein HDQ99_06570 [Lachnospiraceae bacterium]|nr:hypothetical protein [Lachnospiraceae bacterium]
MGHKTKKAVLMKSVSELKAADYSKEPELNRIYQRLVTGRQQFVEILEKNIKAVMQISSLDLTMQHQTEKIMDISNSVARATETIFGSSGSSSGISSNQHEELTHTIIRASEETAEVYKKIETSQNELTYIKDLSAQAIVVSQEMQKDLDSLFQIISRMNSVIADINTISLQTNLLALNASIEAERAGTAGKGFAVVAHEIRSLAGETQKLTDHMGEFIEGIKSASQKSVSSAANTINALDSMTEKIGNVWALNDENQKHIAMINDSMSSLSAVSEELSSSMDQMEEQLRSSTEFMQTVGSDLKNATKPVVEIEKTLDETVKQMGSMTDDAFFHLENQEFAKYVSNAISAHRTWLGNLQKMAQTRTVTPLQLDSSKCGFGHFYYAMTPKMPEMLPIWNGLGDKHKRFHKFGADVINALNRADYFRAEQLCRDAEHYSKELIADLEKLLHMAG